MTIKLIALDIDGTTLRKDGTLSDRNRQALERALARGIHVVVATGRCLSALPNALTDIQGIRYALTSNGAQTIDLTRGETLEGAYLEPDAVMAVADLLRHYPQHMVEIFTDGMAYIERWHYDNVLSGKVHYRSRDYIAQTRNPVDGVLDHMLNHKNEIENVNIFYQLMEDKKSMGPLLHQLDRVTITSSFDNNWEIGGADTSKGAALRNLADRLHIYKEEILACGDSPNDEEMLRSAGVPVAVGNAKDSVKELAVYIAPTCQEDGVAEAIERFAFLP